MSKFNFGFNDSDLVAGFDGNEDGENSISLQAKLGEGIEELKGGAVVEMPVDKVTFKIEGSSIFILVDTDGDGEPVLILELDAKEGLEEIF